MMLGRAIPALPVRAIPAAIGFYRDRLGFDVHYEESGFAILGRDDVEIHLWHADDERWRDRDTGVQPIRSGAESFLAGTGSCRIAVDDVDLLWDELRRTDVLHPASREGPGDTDWGAREFAILDLDGNLLTFFRVN